MFKKVLPILILTFIFCSSCGRPKILSPEEIAAEREKHLSRITRIYPDKIPKEVLTEAIRVFRLADDDYGIVHTENGFIARRSYTIYMVLAVQQGTDTWTVEIKPHDAGTKIVAMHTEAVAGTALSPVVIPSGGMGAGISSTPSNAIMNMMPEPYQLFYSRLEHLLYEKNEWLTCKKAKKVFKRGLDPLCLCANDRTPDGKSAMQRKNAEQEN